MDEHAPDPIRVFLLDDHEIVRRGVRDLLDTEPGITVIGEAGTATAALARIPALKPDVAVLDIRLPDGDGVTVCRDLRSKMPQLACLMLTSFSDDEALVDAIMAGAAGYVLKQIRGTDLVGAIRTIASGQSLLDPQAAATVMRRIRDQSTATDPLAALTDQERRILALIGRTPTFTELGIFSAMWNEHCSYKSSRIHLHKLPTKAPWVIQGPGENAGVIDSGPAPKPTRRDRVSGSATMALIVVLSLSTIAVGVATGAQMPNQPLAS